MFCSTGKPQDKDPRCLIPARLQNKRESCCFIKTTRHSVCSHPCLCVFSSSLFLFNAAVLVLCQGKMICAAFDEVAAELLKTGVEVRCSKLIFLFPFNLPAIAKRANQLADSSEFPLSRPPPEVSRFHFLLTSRRVFVFLTGGWPGVVGLCISLAENGSLRPC